MPQAKSPRRRARASGRRPRRAASRERTESLLHELRHDIANRMMTISASAELLLRQDKTLARTSALRLRRILASCEEIATVLARAGERA